ncbi:MAG: calcium/sodium antiporter [Candidatus Cyclobacteriaceae bacterium M2_1C_046]
MIPIIINFVLVLVGFFLLIKGARALVTGASSLARRFNVPELIIGLTIVALGTSAPEIVVNIISGIQGHSGVVFGNIIGSNNFNLFLILGISGTIYPLAIQRDTVVKEIPFSLFITAVLLVLVNDVTFNTGETNNTSLIDGLILLGLFVLFLGYIFNRMKVKSTIVKEESIEELAKPRSGGKITLLLLGGLLGLTIGGKLVVDNAIAIAEYFEVSQKMIGLTIVAAGTSLPELATTSVAAFNKKADLAIGNVIGSNIFNILLVLGVTTLIAPLQYNTELNIDIYILLGGTSLLMLFMVTLGKKRLDRLEAIIFLFAFVGYMVFLFIRQ